jgi:hypothetical protein
VWNSINCSGDDDAADDGDGDGDDNNVSTPAPNQQQQPAAPMTSINCGTNRGGNKSERCETFLWCLYDIGTS